MLKIDCKKIIEESKNNEEINKFYEECKKKVKKVFFVMLGIGIISIWQYENHKLNEEISKLKAEKLQLEVENTELKKELGECKELQAYVENKKQ
jgi:hypothetical protein